MCAFLVRWYKVALVINFFACQLPLIRGCCHWCNNRHPRWTSAAESCVLSLTGTLKQGNGKPDRDNTYCTNSLILNLYSSSSQDLKSLQYMRGIHLETLRSLWIVSILNKNFKVKQAHCILNVPVSSNNYQKIPREISSDIDCCCRLLSGVR